MDKDRLKTLRQRHDERMDVLLRRSERAVRRVSSIFVATWDQIGALTRKPSTRLRGAVYRQIVELLNRMERQLFKACFDSLADQAEWSFGSAAEALAPSITDEHLALLREDLKPRKGLRGLRRIVDPPSKEDVKKIIYRPVKGMAWTHRIRTTTHTRLLADRLASGISQGLKPSEIRASILPLFHGAKTDAERIIRTEMRRVAHAVQEETLWKPLRPILTGYVRVSQRDGKVRPEHRALDGMRFGPDEDRPELPDKPNCRCYYVPEVAML